MNRKSILKTITIAGHTVKFVSIGRSIAEIKVDNLPSFLWLVDDAEETIDMWCKFLEMEPQVVAGFVASENEHSRRFSRDFR